MDTHLTNIDILEKLFHLLINFNSTKRKIFNPLILECLILLCRIKSIFNNKLSFIKKKHFID